MKGLTSDDQYCQDLICAFASVFPDLMIQGGADEPFYAAARESTIATLYFRDNFPRSLLHEMSHYCLAGPRRRALDDFDYWYTPCGRSAQEQLQFEEVEARPQGLEKVLCEVVGLKFSPSLDDFSGRAPSARFAQQLEASYQEMCTDPPLTAAKAIEGLQRYFR